MATRNLPRKRRRRHYPVRQLFQRGNHPMPQAPSAERHPSFGGENAFDVGGHHYRPNLERALADRIVFQGAEAVVAGQDLCRRQCQCAEDPDLDRAAVVGSLRVA